MSTDLLDAALQCGYRGWPVFPTHDTVTGACSCGQVCDSPGKHPRTPNGLKDASASAALITSWWRRWPTANIAICTGMASFDVLDVDDLGDGRSGWAALRNIRDAGLATGAHTLVRTPRGGLHLYFQPSGNRNGSLPDHHLDCRGDGGYVLAPPSVVNGRPYELLEHRPTADGRLRWDLIKQTLTPPRRSNARSKVDVGSVAALTAWLSTQREGNRNNALFWCCCRAVEHGVTDLQPLVDVAVDLGLTAAAAELTAESALRTYGVVAA